MGTQSFVVYDPDTGAIVRYGYCVESDWPLQARTGEGVISGSGTDQTHYVDVSGAIPVLRQRTTMSIGVDRQEIDSDGNDEVLITGIPPGVTVTVNGVEVGVVTDGAFALTSNAPATFTVELSGPSYLKEQVTIYAN